MKKLLLVGLILLVGCSTPRNQLSVNQCRYMLSFSKTPADTLFFLSSGPPARQYYSDNCVDILASSTK